MDPFGSNLKMGAFEMAQSDMINISCHCGNVKISFPQLPAVVRDCDCPMCNRLGALWADFETSEVEVEATETTRTYRWADGEFEMHHCANCGCTTHYTRAESHSNAELGLNLRMLNRRQLKQIPIAKK